MHCSNDKSLFSELRTLETPQEVTLGDGLNLQATAEGMVTLETLVPDGSSRKCRLENVLLVPKLSYNLLSMSKASEAGKTTSFDNSGCEIVNKDKKVITFATLVGNLYCLEYCRKYQTINIAEKNKERLWHWWYGHIGEQKLQRMASGELVRHLDYNSSKSIGYCETCIGGKHHHTSFDSSKTQSTELLELVHSYVCGRISEKSLVLPDLHRRQVEVLLGLCSKDQVFDRFQ